MDAAAFDLSAIESSIDAARAAAAPPTLRLAPAAADEVSAGIAQLFSQHADEYQKIAERAAAYHGQFVQQLTASASAYSSVEAASAALLGPSTASAAPAATGIGWYDALNLAIDNYLDYLTERIFLVMLLPFWFPVAFSLLPFYIMLAAYFPTYFPLRDWWKLFFLPLL